jgi:hypothetical protein
MDCKRIPIIEHINDSLTDYVKNKEQFDINLITIVNINLADCIYEYMTKIFGIKPEKTFIIYLLENEDSVYINNVVTNIYGISLDKIKQLSLNYRQVKTEKFPFKNIVVEEIGILTSEIEHLKETIDELRDNYWNLKKESLNK